jgi:endonuclease/exonuclease/phosphatase family metal-dependent hydrolase
VSLASGRDAASVTGRLDAVAAGSPALAGLSDYRFSRASWNTGGRDWWSECDPGVDVLLLQEARRPRSAPSFDVLPSSDADWRTAGQARRDWCAAIAAPSGRVQLSPHPQTKDHDPPPGVLLVSQPGTLRVADVVRDGQVVVKVASMYAPWERARRGSVIYADASAHRLLSDLSGLISRRNHRIVAAGDLNILRGYGEHGNAYSEARYATVFDRAEAMGLRCLGPQAPNGRQAQPWPAELPQDSVNVPTYHTRVQTPATATRQLDFVFVSEAIAGQVSAAARNAVDDWGPSDHCEIDIAITV